MKVTIWHAAENRGQQRLPGRLVATRPLLGGYLPGDPVRLVYEYDVEGVPPGLEVFDLAEQAYRMFNDRPLTAWEQEHTARYYEAGNRSLSVGDVVVADEVTMACRSAGWDIVAPIHEAQIRPTEST